MKHVELGTCVAGGCSGRHPAEQLELRESAIVEIEPSRVAVEEAGNRNPDVRPEWIHEMRRRDPHHSQRSCPPGDAGRAPGGELEPPPDEGGIPAADSP